MVPEPLLRVEGLALEFRTRNHVSPVLRGVDLSVREGETAGLIGETGCGKSVTALTIVGLLPSPPAYVTGGAITFDGDRLLEKTPDELQRLRGASISMIFQEPMTSLDPSFTIGTQIGEILTTHRKLGSGAAASETIRLLDLVRVPHPDRVARQYPFELSGGLQQRVMIAMALSCQPRLLLADEPTTALDVTVQAQILELLAHLQRETGTAILLISHDLAVVAETCTRTSVMYAGKIIEEGATSNVVNEPLHPYTRGLLGALPAANIGRHRLAVIPGELPAPDQVQVGCAFAPRCAAVMPRCREVAPSMFTPRDDHRAACFLYEP
jgi:peptide/nickel transport system ATP-binding protein